MKATLVPKQAGELRALVDELARRHQLTPREADVVLEALRGSATKEIAHAIGCAETSVYSHWTRILAKTGVRNRDGFVAYALSLALAPRPRGKTTRT